MSELPPLNTTMPSSNMRNASPRIRPNPPLSPQTMRNPRQRDMREEQTMTPGIFDNTQFTGPQPPPDPVVTLRPQTARLDPLRFGLSSGRIRPARETWAQLTDVVTEFNELCGLDTAVPAFMEQFSYVTQVFKHFNHYAIIIFNSIHPTDDPRSGLTTTPIHKFCRSLVIEWANFIKIFNKIANSKLGPVFRTLLESLNKLSIAINQVAYLFGVDTVKTDVRPSTMKVIDNEMKTMQMLVRKRIRDEEGDSLFLDFDVDNFVRHVCKISKAIQRLFTRSMPRYTSSTGDVMLKKINLNIALNELMDLSKGIANFDGFVNVVRQSIFNMNSAFIDLFKTLNQPYDLQLNEDGSILKEPAPIPPQKPPHPVNAKALSARSPRRSGQ